MKGQQKSKRILIKIAKIFGWIVLSIVLLLIAIALVIQLPPVQNRITQKAISFLQNKIGTKVSLDHIDISFPKAIVLKGLYLEDQHKDTLLYAGRLSIDTDLLALTKHEIELNNISLENCRAYISRPENDSAYNFSYILKAFAGDSTAAPDTVEQSGWRFSIEDITLQNIKAHYHDLLTGNNLDLALGALNISVDEFDLENSKIVVDEIELKNTRAEILQTKVPEVTEEVAEENQPFTYDVGVAQVTLENVHAKYNQQALGEVIRLDLGKSVLETDKVDLKLHRIDLNEFSLSNTFLSYQQLTVKNPVAAAQDPEPQAEKQAEKSKPWHITLDKLNLSENNIQYYDFTKPMIKDAIDFHHLWLSKLNVDARKISMNGSDIACDLRELAFRDRSGFAIESFHARLALSEKSASLENFLLITGNSRIDVNANAGFPSFEHLADTYDRATVQANINETWIGFRDVLYFSPGLADSMPVKLPPQARVMVDASIKGAVNNLTLDHLTVRAFYDTYLKTSGRITGLPDMKKLLANISMDKFYTTKRDLALILPDTLVPQSIDLPAWLNLQGAYKGSLIKSDFKTTLTSNLGEVSLKGNMNLDSASATRGYRANVEIKDFHVGALLKQPQTIGKLNFEASVNSDGLTPKEMNTTVKARMKDFEFHGYHYRNFTLDGGIKNDVLTAKAALPDENLDFTLNANINYSKNVPLYNLTFDLKNLDLKALNLSQRELKARGILTANMATPDFKILNGNLGLRKVAVFNGEAFYAVDSLLFASIDQEGKSELKIDSDLLAGRFEGSFNIFSLGDVINQFFNSYYSLHDSPPAEKKDTRRQHFKFNLKLKKTELLTDILLPDLKSFVPGEISGNFDSETKQLDLRFGITEIKYSNIGVKSFLLSTNANEDALNYNLLADEITVDSLKIDGFEFNGTVAHDSILTNIIILDSLDLSKYMIGGVFHSLQNGYELKLLPGQVKLNYENWTVPADNGLRFGGSKLFAHNVVLANGREKIIIDTKEGQDSTLFIGFRELNLEYLVSMVSRKKLLSGSLDGDINIHQDRAHMAFSSNIGIRNFTLADIPWGNITLAVERKTLDRFDVDFGMKSNKNNITAKGYYQTGEKPFMDLTASIPNFELTTVEPLTMGQLKDLKGLLTGEINVKGSPTQPNINGSINLRNTSFFSTYVKTSFSLKNETISLTPQGISFDKFELLDSDNNTAVLDGKILTKDYKDFAFRLELSANNFRLLNTTAKDNDLFYGKIGIDAAVKIRGTMEQPDINMRLGLTDDSKLTYLVPHSEAGVMEQEGIVEFVDNTFKNDPFMKSINPADTIKTKFTGLNLSAQVDLTDKETFTVVIDPTTGDQLTVKGNSTLTLQMDPTGDMDLSGRYEITDGSYNLSFYKFVKRQFKIEKGSSMTWSGDPMNANMDIKALYEVETAPIDLVANQVEQSKVALYRQRIPFYVHLMIQGELLKPEISFLLDMPTAEQNRWGDVYSQLQDINTRESDLNKQVFALLILKRFISDNPLENQGAQGFEGTARTSVSKMLTEQLNRLSQNIKGVQLSFDVKSYEDYSSGQAEGNTELQLGLSKNLFNDKLVVKVSGNVDVEGENSNRQATDYIGDLALEYKLTKDGRFRITGFRNSDYDMIDGELIDTGTGLIYIKDYNLLSELLKANDQEKKKKKKTN